jgi:hypothetical protein
MARVTKVIIEAYVNFETMPYENEFNRLNRVKTQIEKISQVVKVVSMENTKDSSLIFSYQVSLSQKEAMI